jgi:hypothetical protein
MTPNVVIKGLVLQDVIKPYSGLGQKTLFSPSGLVKDRSCSKCIYSGPLHPSSYLIILSLSLWIDR